MPNIERDIAAAIRKAAEHEDSITRLARSIVLAARQCNITLAELEAAILWVREYE